MKRRILPEEAYDFWAYDNRDGEEGPKRNTMLEARGDAENMRDRCCQSWNRCVIEVCWAVNERKVLKIIERYRAELFEKK